jgi:MFS family permease
MRTTTPERSGRTLLAAVLAQLAASALAWSGVVAQVKASGISVVSMGWVWGSASLGLAVAAPLGTRAVATWGARRVGAVALALAAVVTLARLADTGLFALAAILFALGVTLGLLGPSIAAALVFNVKPSSLEPANAAVRLAYTLGTAVVVVALERVGVEVAAWVTSVALLVAAALWWVVVRVGASTTPRLTRPELRLLMGNPGLRRVASMHFLVFGGFLSLLAVLCVTQGPVPVVGWLVAAAAGNVVGPWLSSRLGLRRPVLAGGALAAGLALVAFAVHPSLLLLAVAGFAAGLVGPLVLSLPLELPYSGPSRLGAALGLVMFGGQLGGFVVPTVAFAVAHHLGAGAAVVLLAVVHLLILIPSWRLAETGPRAPIPPAQVDFGEATA